MEPEELHQFQFVSGIFSDSYLDVLMVLLIEIKIFLVVLKLVFLFLFFLVISLHNVIYHVQTLLDQLSTDLFYHFGLLELFSVHIQREVITINHSLNEVQVLRQQFIKRITNQNSPDIQFDIALFALVVLIVEILRSSLRNVKDTSELHSSVSLEMSISHRIFFIFAKSLIEFVVFFFINVFCTSGPNSLVYVLQFEVPVLFSDGFSFWFFIFLVFLFVLDLQIVFFFFPHLPSSLLPLQWALPFDFLSRL